MDDDRFWSLIEAAWKATHPKQAENRKALAAGSKNEDDAAQLEEAAEDVVEELRTSLNALSREALLAFDRILERSLYRIDRAEIQERTDGSDDGFLYARGFIVLLGREYFNAVDKTPATAVMDVECEDLTYLPWHMYQEKFGDVPDSGISRETGSNTDGWP